ncbi:MAG: UDPGP type 1 family protein [Phycisphaerae bacterium]|nr:UDPGP type 1 family protein [Phycisphaerae bacterium]
MPDAVSAPVTLESMRRRLKACGQEHLLAHWDSLPESNRRALLSRLADLPLESLRAMLAETESHAGAGLDSVEPVPVHRRDQRDATRFRAEGERLLREGRVAAFTVAGGQGTRLGWRGPKGTFPATVITGKPLFRVFAEQIRAAERRYGRSIPWYVMTSPLNDAETRAFFKDNDYFGREAIDHFFLPQGVVPTLDLEGRVLLAERDEPAANPDGHGGSLRALRRSGAIDDMLARGISVMSYFQVDNPLVHVVDPLFLGLHASAPDSSAEMSSKCVPKRNAQEKVGVLCRARGRGGRTVTRVVEYSDLPRELAERRGPEGRLVFDAGSIAVHAISVAFVARLTEDLDRFALPWHRAVKKTPYFDPATGRTIEPDKPNSVKFESFVFDALELAERSLVLETPRIEEFAPIKNAEGEDSPAHSHELQSERAASWLESNGVKVPRRADGTVDARIEISPLTALEAADLAGVAIPQRVERGHDLVL